MGKFIDLTGKKYGEITVLEKDIELSTLKKRIYWKCQCSCGRIKSIRGDALKQIQTCGECIKDLSNQRFGRLIAIRKGKKDKAQHQFWICKCDCGKIVEINSDNLRRGTTQSCGCLHSEITHNIKFRDITNEKFGKLTAIDYIMDKNNKVYWYCLCDCGNYCIVAGSNLKNGHTQSCGCIHSSIGEINIVKLLEENGIEYVKEYTFTDLPNRRFDFYLPKYNRLIEFDGKQHFKYIHTWHKSEEAFILAQQRDIEKNNYALEHNISLVRIPYTERNNITLEMILGDKFLVIDMKETLENKG